MSLRLLSGDVTSFLMTEARQHNTEIRQSIGKVADKVDQLTSKVFAVCLLLRVLRIVKVANFGLRFDGTELHPGRFTLDCEPPKELEVIVR